MGSSSGSEEDDGSEASSESGDSDGQEESETGVNTSDSCTPGESFVMGCNSCECPASGKKSEAETCTDEVCPPCSGPEDCEENEYCEFGQDACGVLDEEGECHPKPENCEDADSMPTCACDGRPVDNACEAAQAGWDVMKFGGCSMTEGGFQCIDRSCDQGRQYCRIEINDVAGEDEPPYFYACIDRPNDCTDSICDCLFDPGAFERCLTFNDQTFVFRPFPPER